MNSTGAYQKHAGMKQDQIHEKPGQDEMEIKIQLQIQKEYSNVRLSKIQRMDIAALK